MEACVAYMLRMCIVSRVLLRYTRTKRLNISRVIAAYCLLNQTKSAMYEPSSTVSSSGEKKAIFLWILL